MATDSLFVISPQFQALSASQVFVTPTGGTLQTLSDALAEGGGNWTAAAVSAISANLAIAGGMLDVVALVTPSVVSGPSNGIIIGSGAVNVDVAAVSGVIDISSGTAGTAGEATGDAYLYSGAVASGSGRSGGAGLGTGNTAAGLSGNTFVYTGDSAAGASGSVYLVSGAAATDSGSVLISSAAVTGGGHVSGNISLTIGAASGGATAGNLKLVNVATADPVVTDAVWANNGVLMLSGATLAAALAATDLSALPVADPGGGRVWLKAGDLHVGV